MASEALPGKKQPLASDASDEQVGMLEAASDRVNAILVKEVRQALKSRTFVATFMLMLTGAWLISIFGMLFAGSEVEYGSTGRGFFMWFYVVLTVAAVVIVPYGTFRSLLNERDLETFELLHITTLKPRQIVWGKLLCAMVQLFIFYSAITPFIAFASLLQGFDAPRATFYLTAIFFGSLLLSMAALMISTLAEKRIFQGFTSMATLGGLVMALFPTLGGTIFAMTREQPSLNDPKVWWIVLFAFLGAASYFALFLQITTSRLTFETGNRSTGIRIVALIQFVLLWSCYWLWVQVFGRAGDKDAFFGMTIGTILHWGVLGWFFCSENGFLSRRIRRDLPRSKFLRLLMTPLLPGGSRGYLFVLLNLAVFWWLMVIAHAHQFATAGGAYDANLFREFIQNAVTLEASMWPAALQVSTWLCAYLAIFLGISASLAHWTGVWFRELRPAHVRLIVLLVMAAGIITPNLIAMTKIAGVPRFGYHLIFFLDPIRTCNYLASRGSRGLEGEAIGATLILAGIVVLINLPVLIQGTTYILRSKINSRSRPQEIPDNA